MYIYTYLYMFMHRFINRWIDVFIHIHMYRALRYIFSFSDMYIQGSQISSATETGLCGV